MKLEVLPGGDVAAARAGVLLGDLSQHLHLVGGDAPIGELDPHHLLGLLALAVDAVQEAEGAELLQQPFLVLAEASGLPLEDIDLLVQGDEDVSRLAIRRYPWVWPWSASRSFIYPRHRPCPQL